MDKTESKILVVRSTKAGVCSELFWILFTHMLSTINSCFSSPEYFFLHIQTAFSHLMQLTATLLLAAACSSAGVTVLFLRDVDICKKNPELSSVRYTISVAMAFAAWLLVAKSSLVMLWMFGIWLTLLVHTYIFPCNLLAQTACLYFSSFW